MKPFQIKSFSGFLLKLLLGNFLKVICAKPIHQKPTKTKEILIALRDAAFLAFSKALLISASLPLVKTVFEILKSKPNVSGAKIIAKQHINKIIEPI